MTIEILCPGITADFLIYVQALSKLNSGRKAYVTITPYKGDYLEYQYSGEAKQIIPSLGKELTYEFVPVKKQCPGLQYKLIYESARISNGAFQGWETYETTLPATVATSAPYSNIKLMVAGQIVSHINANGYPYHWSWRNTGMTPVFSGSSRIYQLILDASTVQNYIAKTWTTTGISILGFELVNPNPPCPDDCKFIVYRDGIEIFDRTDDECPDVNLVPCQLDLENSTEKTFDFGLLSLLAVIQGKGGIIPPNDLLYFNILQGHHYIVNPGIDLISPLVELQALALDNPSNALTFYYVLDLKNNIFSAQYFSDPGCPPPIYSYTCDEGNQCPDGTCKVDCGEIYCCYNDEGISVFSFNK